ncbi:AraC family transcriptional regulator [Brachybacterium avium]|uniref:AraC family transcriptional regulator n=1 Tax=Brachybacterium avium TaxID=2017485 RepID=A0A220UCW4_9MICO|nr:AraC family transcriptional regulator [Brachybacterium avium]
MAHGAVPGVRSGSIYRASGLEPGVHRGLPSTTLTTIFSLDGPVVGLQEIAAAGAAPGIRPEDGAILGPRAELVLAGLHTAPVLIEQPTHQEGIQLQLDPCAARLLCGVRAADLVGGFDGAAVLGRAGRDLWEQIGGMAAGPERLERIAGDFRARCDAAPAGAGQLRPELAEAWRLLLTSRGRIAVEALARRVLLSPRQLRTEFTREFGIGPKSAARLARFEAALGRIAGAVHAGRSPDLSGIAAECGYADHAHLTREFGRFTGTTPSRWICEERRNLQAGGHGTAQD